MDRQKMILMVGNGLVLAALALGCDAADGPEVELRPGSGAGGVWLNTNAIGAHAFSEIDLKAAAHDGVRLQRVLIPSGGSWLELEKIEFDAGGQLRGKLGTHTYAGAGLLGSKWEVKLVQGSTETPATMWIDDFEQVAPGEVRYTFMYTDVDGAAQYVCDADVDGDHSVVPIKDITVDEQTGVIATRKDTLYMACTSGAVGKAVVWGYKPWQRTVDDFEAAVRMVRADYCYDGVSWTVPGTPVEVRDKWGINTFVTASHPTEAVWGKDHLLCLAQPRNSLYPRESVTCGGAALPVCPNNVSMSTYGGTVFWLKNDPQ